MFYKMVVGFFKIFYAMFFKFEVHGLDNIPSDGAGIICSNHLSNWDPPTVAVPLKRLPSFVAKKELYNNKFFGKCLLALDTIPIDREKADMQAFRNAMDRLKKGYLVAIFAAGHRMKEFEAKDSKAGVALFAVKSGAPVIPTAIISDYRFFKKVVLIFGERIDFSESKGKKYSSEQLSDISTEIMEKVNSLIKEYNDGNYNR